MLWVFVHILSYSRPISERTLCLTCEKWLRFKEVVICREDGLAGMAGAMLK